jgi:hypothetical protein
VEEGCDGGGLGRGRCGELSLGVEEKTVADVVCEGVEDVEEADGGVLRLADAAELAADVGDGGGEVRDGLSRGDRGEVDTTEIFRE